MDTKPQDPKTRSEEEELKEFELNLRIEYLKSEEDTLRENAAYELGTMEDLRAVEPLIEALHDKEWTVRMAAAESLGQLGDARAVAPLIECVADKNGAVRDKAMEALQAVGEPSVEGLLAALKDERPHLRKQIIFVLGELRRILGEAMDSRASEPILNALKDPMPAVREAAAACIREFKLTHAEERMVGSLKDERFGTRFYTVQKMAEIGRQDDSGKESVVPHLIGAIEDPQLGPVAAEGLGSIGDPRAVEPLLASLDRDNMRQIGVTALLQIGEPSVLPLIEKMKSENPKVRAEVAWGLGMLKDPRAVEALIAASEDEEAEVRRHAIMALGLMQDARAVGPLIAALADEGLSEEAKDALVPIGEPAVEPLLAALEGATGRVRRDVLWVLGMIRDQRATEPLIAALKDEDPETRAVAILGIGMVRDPRAVEPLIEAMREDRFANEVAQALADIGEPAVDSLIRAMESPEQELLVRQKAAKALGLIKEPRAVDSLIHALKDPLLRHHAATVLIEFRRVATARLLEAAHDEDPEVRTHVVAALGFMMDTETLPLLLECMRDPDASVRAQAALALGRLEDRRAVPELITALGDADENVRRLAVRAIGLLKEKEAVDPLVGLLSEGGLREEVSEALLQIGDPAVDALIAVLAMPEPKTVHAPAPEEESAAGPGLEETAAAGDNGEAGAAGRTATEGTGSGGAGACSQPEPEVEGSSPLEEREGKVVPAAGPGPKQTAAAGGNGEAGAAGQAAAEGTGSGGAGACPQPEPEREGSSPLEEPEGKVVPAAGPGLEETAAAGDGEAGTAGQVEETGAEAVEDVSWKIRKEAAWTLGMIRNKRAVEPLIAALKNDCRQVKMSAIEALGRLEAAAAPAIEPLIEVIKTDVGLRKAAGGSLILIGEPALDAVVALRKNTDPDVSAFARWILDGIGQAICQHEAAEDKGPPKELLQELGEFDVD